ncbi:ion channel [Bacteroides sp.]|uniref:ion channel n=1 Tax=Bacteroides sp. TaxID=29523 RepID=UPI0034595BE0
MEYGDIYPITPIGRLLSSLISLIGIAMIAITTGIISSAFMNMLIEKKQKAEKEKDK